MDPVIKPVFMSPCHDISPKSTKIGYFTNIFANLNPLFMIDPVFGLFSHFTFPHTFSAQFLIGIVPKLPSLEDFVKAPKSKKDFGIQTTLRNIESK